MANYISNKDLITEIVACQITSKVSNKLALMLVMVVERYSLKPNFRSYSYRDEMIAEALAHLCCSGPKNTIPPSLRFDMDYARKKAEKHGVKALPVNPLAYLTQIIHNSFIKTLKTEKNLSNIRDEIRMSVGLPSFGKQIDAVMKPREQPKEQPVIEAKEPAKRGRPRKVP